MRRCSKMGLNRGPWTPQEDDLLLKYIQKKGEGSWRTLPMKAGLMRCGKSCRLRWMNYLRPDVKRGKISPDEEDLILRMHRLLGNRWSLIAGRIPGRTDNEIKNFWNTHLSKKLISQGVDPRTHKPLSESELVNDNEDNNLSQGASYENTYPQTANVLADKNEVAENNNSPGHLNANELPEILGIPNHAFNDAPISSFQDSVYTCEQNSSNDNNVTMNQTFIPHPNTTLEYEQDVLTRNTIHSNYFLPPALPDLICQENIPHQNQSNRFCSSIKETNPHKGFPLGFEQIEIQQHQILPHATIEDQYMHNSDILSYFLEASMNDPQFNIGGTNKHAAAFLSENRQRFSETELMNRIEYNLWSIIFPPSQYPFSFS